MIHKNDFDGNLKMGGKTFHQASGRDVLVQVMPYQKEYEVYDINNDDVEILDECPLCGSRTYHALLQKHDYTICRCADCDFGFQNPRAKESALKKVYTAKAKTYESFSSEASIKLARIRFEYAFQEVAKYHHPDSVLDIGSGIGLFLDVARQNGVKHIFGIEQNEYQYQNSPFCNDAFQVSHNFDFSFLKESAQSIDLITMFCVLEHVLDFKGILKNVHTQLSQGGIYLVEVPNLNSLASRLIREKSPCFHIEHVNYFSMNNLNRVLEETGFTILQKETIISEISNVKNYLEFKEPYLSNPDGEAAFNFITPEWIHQNEMGSRLLIVAQKK